MASSQLLFVESMTYSVSQAPLKLYVSEMLPEIHTVKKCDFLKPIIHSQIIQLSVLYVQLVYLIYFFIFIIFY